MSETANLLLPLLAASQSQKHVTVNEALTRLDAACQLVLQSATRLTPPAAVPDGLAWAVPAGATDAWAGQAGQVALGVNGGWVFVPPARGWRASVLDRGDVAVFDGTDWRRGAVSLTPSGAGMQMETRETDVVLTAGASVTTGVVLPARSVVLGVTGRVIAPITGTLTSWRVGDAASDGRFGTGLGLALNSWVEGPASPGPVWGAEGLVLTAEGGDFAGGTVRLAAHVVTFARPDAV